MTVYERVLKMLIEKKYHICFAESCTGGGVCHQLVRLPDASKVLRESYITYSNEAKIRVLGVDPESIERFTVISPEVAKEMACGARKASRCEIGVGITGVAGPSIVSGIPVGTVCFSIAIGKHIKTFKAQFKSKDRCEIIDSAISFIYNKIKEVLENEAV